MVIKKEESSKSKKNYFRLIIWIILIILALASAYVWISDSGINFGNSDVDSPLNSPPEENISTGYISLGENTVEVKVSK